MYYYIIDDDWAHAVPADSTDAADAAREAAAIAADWAADHRRDLAADGSADSGYADWAIYAAAADGSAPDWDEAEAIDGGTVWAHPDAPDCVDGDGHDWLEDGETYSTGGQHYYAEAVCTRCGVTRTSGEDAQAHRPGTGIQGVEYVRYEDPAEVSWAAWADDYGHEAVEGSAATAAEAIAEARDAAADLAEEQGGAYYRVGVRGLVLAEDSVIA